MNQNLLVGIVPFLLCNFWKPRPLFMHFNNKVYRCDKSSSVQLSSSLKLSPSDKDLFCLFFLDPLKRILTPTLGWFKILVAWSVVAIETPKKNVATFSCNILNPVVEHSHVINNVKFWIMKRSEGNINGISILIII